MSNRITGLPGYPTANVSWGPRLIREGGQGARYLPGGAVIKGSTSGDPTNTGYVDVIQPGKIMVQENSGGLYRNFIIGKSTAAYVDNDTTITVGAATATEVARLITVAGGNVTLLFSGPATAAGVIAHTALTVTAASGTTITVGDLNVGKVTDSLITLPVAGYTAGTFCLVDDNQFTKLSDENGARLNVPFPLPLIGGLIKVTQLLDWPADTSTVAYLKGLLSSTTGDSLFNWIP